MDCLSFLCVQPERQVAAQVLRKLQDGFPGRCDDLFIRLIMLVFRHEHIIGCRQGYAEGTHSGFSGIRWYFVRVNDLSVFIVRETDRTVIAPLPAVISHDDLFVSCLINDFQLCDQAGNSAVSAGAAFGSAGSAIPAVCQFHRNCVFSGPDQFSHIICLVLDTLMIIRRAGSKDKVADTFPVDPGLIFTAGRDIQTGTCSIQGRKCFPKAVHRIAFLLLWRIVASDPPGFPVRNAHFKERFAPRSRFVVFVPQANFPIHPLPIGKHFGIVSMHGGRSNLAAVPFFSDDLVSSLLCSSFADPHQARIANVDTDGVCKVFSP